MATTTTSGATRSPGGARPAGRVRAYLGLGANLGDAAAILTWAVEALGRLRGVRVRSVSPLYATAPWGVTDQPEFRNAVVGVDVAVPRGVAADAAALALLADLKDVERRAGRRPGRRWGPRELDVDILVFGRHVIHAERPAAARSLDADAEPAKAARRLDVPHREAAERLFVLAPLADLAPRLVPPGWAATVERRRREVEAEAAPGSVRLVGRWDPAARRWR